VTYCLRLTGYANRGVRGRIAFPRRDFRVSYRIIERVGNCYFDSKVGLYEAVLGELMTRSDERM
jgi:hypothetical protein